MLEQIKVYVTSKREHAEKILSAIPDGIHMNARWPYMRGTEQRPVTHWLRENFDDAIAAHYVILYVEPGDNLKTSVIEVGNAVAWGKKIYIAGDRDFEDLKGLPHKDLEPWVGFTNQVKVTGSLEQTFAFIKRSAAQRMIVNHDGSKSNA